MNAIEVANLSKIFTGKRFKKVEALSSLNFSVSQGEVFGFLGPNGAGKSTTIKCLMGLVKPTCGSGLIFGEEIGSASSRQKVGFLPENPAFYDYLTAEEYLLFVGSVFKISTPILVRRMEDTLKLLELWDARKRPIRGYSKGMVQRVGLAQAIIHDPDLYILDEPMSGLDPLGRALVKEIILDLKKRGKTVFFSTHITDDVEKVCDKVAVIVKGRLQALDRVESILQKGIEGYMIHLSAATNADAFQRFKLLRSTEAFLEFTVSSQDLPEFMCIAGQTSAEVLLVEARRRNLEAFFLDIIQSDRKKNN